MGRWSGIAFLSGSTVLWGYGSNAHAEWRGRAHLPYTVWPAHRVYYAPLGWRHAPGTQMNYRAFERLVIGAGVVTIIASVLISLASNGWSGWPNLISQLLLLPVLIVAVHYGRRAGLFAALVASAVFVILKTPVLSALGGVSTSDLAMIAYTIAAFGLVGIVGGDICGRVKYLFARYDQSATIDDWSLVYNQRRAAQLIENARQRFSRYGEPFSVIEIAPAPALLSGLRPTRQRAMVRSVANHIRGDVRMIDEVARLDDGRFLVILPHTARDGGLLVSERLVEGVCRTLGAEDELVSSRCYSAAEDELEIDSLEASIASQPQNYAVSSA
jgi:GGDEF domain-containing protein